MDLSSLPEQAKKVEKETRHFFKAIKTNRLRELDDTIHAIHEEVFEEFDCLECANCCRSLGPRLTDRDIEKISYSLRLKLHEVIDKYLRIDEDKDYVFKEMPCPFLCSDNYYSIYDDRPKACREYLHKIVKSFSR